MVVPGLYGFISACKWIERITLTTYAAKDSYWTKRDWATNAPIKISSRIDTPKVLETIDAGDTFIGGIAWAQQNGGVARVQVQIDGGAWQDAMLGPSAGNDYWRQWYLPWRPSPAPTTSACRVVDGKGDTQSSARMDPFPEGSSGIQQLIVKVAYDQPIRAASGTEPRGASHLRKATPVMNRSSLRRTGAAGAALIALTLGLAACGDDADSGSSASDDTRPRPPLPRTT